MSSSAQFLNPGEAARRLGVSAKALRLYEQRGLVTPVRTAAGWRVYGPDQMARAGEVAALRGLGFSLAQVGRVLAGDSSGLEPALAAHQAGLEAQARRLFGTVETVRGLRDSLARGETPSAAELARLARPAPEPVVAFDLPWPWGGERFELRDMRAINYIVGPLGSGKTRLARKLAEALPGATFLRMERVQDDWAAALASDAGLKTRVEAATAWLVEDGATRSDDLTALLAALEVAAADPVVVDMVEQGLDEATQEALIAHLRRRGSGARPLFLLTRSCAILDLTAVGPDETILFCPANHSPPLVVAAHPGASGYEAVAMCLAPPEVRARTEGVIAYRPPAA